MADFYPILSRAIAGLPDKSPEARRAVYDRARTALVAQLRSLDPPLGEAEIMRERLALDEAVSRVEADLGEAEENPPLSPPQRPVVAEPEPLPPPPPAPPRDRDDEAENAPRNLDEEPAEPAEPQVLRPRVAPPRERRVDPGHIRTAVVGGGVAVAVMAIAVLAYYVNKNPPDAARPRTETAAPAPSQTDSAGKISDRVGDAGAGQNPGQAPRAGSGTPAPAAQGGEVAVAQRAILYTEDPNSPQQPQAINGRAFWRLDSESAGQGRPVETIVRATVEVPDAGLSLDFTIRRNADSAFPASHIIGMRFTRTGAQAADAVREVGVPQFKTEEGERGAPISAISSALGENLFVAALSNVPVEIERNLELMQTRSWIDIPVRFASGRRGIITFEKGVSGNQTLADAFSRWR